MGSYKSIAIDGPAGAGKTSLARMLAERFDFLLVDTGAMYRAIGLHACENGVDPNEEAAMAKLLPGTDICLRYDKGRVQRVILNGRDVSEEIRSPAISMYASAVSALPPVRAFLLDLQRGLALKNNVIMDGRDIGTVILPNADVKIFLTASDETRARRRFAELQEKGLEPIWEEVLRDMRTRDRNDSSRAAAPLRPAQDSIIVDTTDLTLEQSFEVLSELIGKRLCPL